MASEELDLLRKLLEERKNSIRKIEKLKEIEDQFKPHIFKKVYQDYEKRLKSVMEKIDEKRADIQKALGHLKNEREKYITEKRKLEDEMEEAKLRYTVGEYDEAVFRAARGEKAKSIKLLGGKIKELEKKIEFFQASLGEEVPHEEVEVASESEEIEELEEIGEPTEAIVEEKEDAEEIDEIESLLEQALSPEEVDAEKKKPPEKKEESREDSLVSEKLLDEMGKKGEKKKVITCQKCGHDNPPDSYFCEECGSELIVEDIDL